MKILTVIFNLKKGGTQRVAQVFAEAYRQLGHDSRVLAMYGLGPRYDELKETVPVWQDFSRSVLREIQQWTPDIIHIHSHGIHGDDMRTVLDAVKGEQTRVVETNVFSRPSPWTDRLDVSFQLSIWALWLYQFRGGKRAAVVPNPVHCARFKPAGAERVRAFRAAHGIPADAFVIGRIGQAAEFSWSPLLLKAFNGLAAKYEKLYLVAVNPSPPIRAGIERSPFKNRAVVIPEIIGDDLLSAAYSSFDLMVHAAEGGESFGLVNAESILCGTPVVTLSTPWASNSQCEVVGNRKGGYVVHRLRGMKKAVEHFMKNGDIFRFAERGPERIRENYDHLQVARMAVDCAMHSGEIPAEGVRPVIQQIKRILADSFDRPGLLTQCLIAANRNRARKLTIYTSLYRFMNRT